MNITTFTHVPSVSRFIQFSKQRAVEDGSYGTIGYFRNYSPAAELTYPGKANTAEELMRLSALTIAAATALTFAFPQTSVIAQGHDDGVVGRTLRLDGRAPLGSDTNGQSGGRSESTEPTASAKSEKAQTGIEKTGDTAIRTRSPTHIGLRSHAKHRFVFHRRGHHMMAFHMPRPRFVIHRHGRRFVALNEFGTV